MEAAAGSTEAVTGSVLLGLAVITVAAFTFGRLALKLRQPAVMGEIVAGILLGPTLLGLLPGDLTERLFPEDARPHLQVLAQLGLVLFMFGVGYRLDLTHLRGTGPLVVSVSLSSVVLPFALGSGLAVLFYPWMDRSELAGSGAMGPALFLGTAMSITAFPVLARIIYDRGMTQEPMGALSLACAAIQDVLAWCVLAGVVLAVNAGGSMALARMVIGSVLLVVALLYLVRPALTRLTGPGRRQLKGTPALLAVLVPGTLICAWLTNTLGLHPIFGAFAFGAAVPRKSVEEAASDAPLRIEQMSLLLLPAFFTMTGLSVGFSELGAQGAVMVVCVFFAACAGKFIGATGVAWLHGLCRRDSLLLGVLLNTRGLTELIILNVGLELGLIDTRMFTVMVIMALATTFMTGPLLERLMPRSSSSDIVTAQLPPGLMSPGRRRSRSGHGQAG
ncbi:cation:proton antiporter [Streptomyces sp. NPDC047525]|uniref:cation:proton antiporter n=1 Tax=Streptomyces sp. NPDC047525 TaxID=3155264 RepID=UPI0033D16643